MRWIVLLAALAMPLVAWLSQTGQFGPTNGAISDRYPTLLVAAGYAFSIWGLIFLWDVAALLVLQTLLLRTRAWRAPRVGVVAAHRHRR